MVDYDGDVRMFSTEGVLLSRPLLVCWGLGAGCLIGVGIMGYARRIGGDGVCSCPDQFVSNWSLDGCVPARVMDTWECGRKRMVGLGGGFENILCTVRSIRSRGRRWLFSRCRVREAWRCRGCCRFLFVCDDKLDGGMVDAHAGDV